MIKRTGDHIYYFMHYGVDTESREIYMGTNPESENTGVDYLMASRVIKSLSLLDKHKGDIRIIMNNEGGFWTDGIAMYDYIVACKNKVNIDVFGEASSMGAILLQAADKRRMAKHAKLMMHYGKMGMESEHPEIYRRWAKESTRVKGEIENIFLKRMRVANSDIKINEIKEMLMFDTILSAHEACKYGLCDEII